MAAIAAPDETALVAAVRRRQQEDAAAGGADVAPVAVAQPRPVRPAGIALPPAGEGAPEAVDDHRRHHAPRTTAGRRDSSAARPARSTPPSWRRATAAHPAPTTRTRPATARRPARNMRGTIAVKRSMNKRCCLSSGRFRGRGAQGLLAVSSVSCPESAVCRELRRRHFCVFVSLRESVCFWFHAKPRRRKEKAGGGAGDVAVGIGAGMRSRHELLADGSLA